MKNLLKIKDLQDYLTSWEIKKFPCDNNDILSLDTNMMKMN